MREFSYDGHILEGSESCRGIRHTAEQIINKHREAEVLLTQGMKYFGDRQPQLVFRLSRDREYFA